jgi:ribosomal protein S18 acetylase RimI-like enzyme
MAVRIPGMPNEKDDLAWVKDVRIRTLRGEELPELEWGGEYTRFRRVYRNAFERSQEGLSVLWVAEHSRDGIIGQLFIQLDSEESDLADGRVRAYLFAFRIRPPYRCKGLGTIMLRHAEDDLVVRGFREITLTVTRDNLDAIKLYQRNGYRISGPDAGRWSYPDAEGNWQTVEQPSWRMIKQLLG